MHAPWQQLLHTIGWSLTCLTNESLHVSRMFRQWFDQSLRCKSIWVHWFVDLPVFQFIQFSACVFTHFFSLRILVCLDVGCANIGKENWVCLTGLTICVIGWLWDSPAHKYCELFLPTTGWAWNKACNGPGHFLGSYVIHRMYTIHLVQWLGWVFAIQERKKEREERDWY